MKQFNITSAFLLITAATLAGCSSTPKPNPADMMMQHANQMQDQVSLQNTLATNWKKGAELVEKGEKNAKNAEKTIKDAEKSANKAQKELEKAQSNLDQAKADIEQGKKMMQQSEQEFKIKFPGLSLSPTSK